MILNSLDKQLVLAENGQITWQKDLTNPVPGEVVAEIKKGDAVLSPTCSLVDSPVLESEDKEAVLKFISEWLGRYVAVALEPLFKLKEDDIPEGAPRDIATKIYEALGVIPREQLQSLIAQMDEDKRNALRTKKIRFGPLLVYLPELNKPAAVRLRGLLLSLWQDKDLPAEVPADGIVSFSVEGKELDNEYYQSVGYPIYGPRSIRVDMLDRVICAVYDTAKDGKFMAQHQMAEWLGSNIVDLYAVLEAMGHKKIHDPADEVAVEVEEVKADDVKVEEAVPENPKPVVEGAVTEEVKAEEAKPQEKPALATFALKKGKAIGGAQASGDSSRKESKNKKFSNMDFKSDKKKFKPDHKKSGKKPPPRQHVYTAEAESKPEDSPFAILQQLKTGKKD